MSSILFIMTAADHWDLADGSSHPTGFWAEEAVVPLEAFLAAGHEVVVATPGGVVPPVDEASLATSDDSDTPGRPDGEHLRKAIASSEQLTHPIPLDQVDLDRFAAVFVPGGHGPMQDLAVDPLSGNLLTRALDAGLLVSVVCHGPAALLAATREDGTNAFAGYRLAAFTNAEEDLGGLATKARWLLHDRLRAAGLRVDTGTPYKSHTASDRTLLSGQNPASSSAVADLVLERLAPGRQNGPGQP